MLFNSFEFLGIFLPLFLAGFFLLPDQRLRLVFLVVAGYVFYGAAEWWLPVLLLATTTVSFATGIGLSRARA